MQRRPAALIPILLPAMLAACGGGVAQQDATPAPAPVPAYRFVAPRLGEHLEYAASLVDNLGNTLNRTVTEDVTALNADGSFAVHEEDPSHDSEVSGVTDQTLYPTDFQYNAAGQATSLAVTRGGGILHCTLAGAEGSPGQLASGADWNTSYTQSCDSGTSIAFTQSGTLAGIESVTVPAGTFNAYKFESTTSSTTGGVTRTETNTKWRDSAGTDSRVIKDASVYTYSGASAPAGAPLQQVRQLQSYR